MKTHKNNTQKGFIALFFTISMSTALLVYVAMSSYAVFDAMRMKNSFLEYRDIQAAKIDCIDKFVDVFIRSSNIQSKIYGCNISHIRKNNDDLYVTSGDVNAHITIHNGFIVDILSSYFSL